MKENEILVNTVLWYTSSIWFYYNKKGEKILIDDFFDSIKTIKMMSITVNNDITLDLVQDSDNKIDRY